MNTYKASSTSMENSRNSLRRIARNDDTEFSHQSILNAMDQFVRSVSTMDETILVPCRLMDLKVGDADDTTVTVTTKKAQQQESTNSKYQAVAKNSNNGVGTVLNGSDLFDMYNMLHAIKGQLLWGQEEMGLLEGSNQQQLIGTGRTSTYAEKAGAAPTQQQLPSVTGTTAACSQLINSTSEVTIMTGTMQSTGSNISVPGHVRRPSTVSVSSTNSCTSGVSDTDSELGNENDSGIDELTKANNPCPSSSLSTTSSSASSDTNTTVDRTQLVAHNFRRHLAGLHRSLRQMTDAAQYLTKRYQHDIGQAGQL